MPDAAVSLNCERRRGDNIQRGTEGGEKAPRSRWRNKGEDTKKEEKTWKSLEEGSRRKKKEASRE